jgi:hypothetical protein
MTEELRLSIFSFFPLFPCTKLRNSNKNHTITVRRTCFDVCCLTMLSIAKIIGKLMKKYGEFLE